jgi:ubiquinone/menaquinone biosynthesis C-methylase UbiE
MAVWFDLGQPHPGGAVPELLVDEVTTFDVAESEEASVALYSLGNPALLGAATGELVRLLQEWGVSRPSRAVLDLGCGIGRVAARLAPPVGSVRGIDISPGMIAAARRRCAGLPNVQFAVCDGADLSMCGASCPAARRSRSGTEWRFTSRAWGRFVA